MENSALCKWGCAHANGFVVLAEGLDVFKLVAIAAGGRGLLSGDLSIAKRLRVEWMSESRNLKGKGL
jgi:hypothetical protein